MSLNKVQKINIKKVIINASRIELRPEIDEYFVRYNKI